MSQVSELREELVAGNMACGGLHRLDDDGCYGAAG
jgi:hypothetical protein